MTTTLGVAAGPVVGIVGAAYDAGGAALKAVLGLGWYLAERVAS